MKKFTLFTLFFLCFGLFSRAQYADKGNGIHKSKIWWFDWNGFTLANNASRTFTTADGLSVTITFSKVFAETLRPKQMNTWRGAIMWQLYDFTNPSIMPAFYGDQTYDDPYFTMSVVATRNGLPVPFTFVTADAEASADVEVTTLTTNGGAWQTIDFFRNTSFQTNPVTGCNTQKVVVSNTFGGDIGLGENPLLATTSPATGALVVDVLMDKINSRNGAMGQAFGIFAPIDRGDLPASYGYVQHALTFNAVNSCNYLPPMPGLAQDETLFMGAVPGDADGAESLNDNAIGVDEDAITSFPKYGKNGAYALTVPLHNTTGKDAWLTGYFDMNRDGTFGTGEAVTVRVLPGATQAVINWTGVPADLSNSVNYAFRFRLTSDRASAEKSGGYAPDGEVEDYFTPIAVVNAAFITADTVCVNTPVAITDQSTHADTYNWNFCGADINAAATGNNYGNPGATLAIPAYMDYAYDNGNYYGFVVNNFPGGLVRLNFGNSLLNTPVATYLGNLGGTLVASLQGIQLLKEGNEWFAFVVGGDAGAGVSSRIIKLAFGTSITNAPVATNWGNIGGLSYPHDLYMFKESGVWHGLTVNYNNNTVTKFTFGSDFSQPPAGVNLGNLGSLSQPTGICPVKDNTTWRLFVTNYGSSTLSRIDFGNSLANTPTASVNLGNPGNLLKNPRDLYVFDYCSDKVGFIINDKSTSNILCRLNFSSFVATPSVTVLPAAGLIYPHSISRIFREGPNLHAFVPDADNNTLTRISFTGNCTAASIGGSTLANPPAVSYSQPGIYSINLLVDEGLNTQQSFCKTVLVIAPPPVVPVVDTAVCADSVILKSRFSDKNIWSNNSTLDSLIIRASGTYWVESDVYGCTARDSFNYRMAMLPALDLGRDTAFCENGSIDYHFTQPDAAYQWQDGNTADSYSITTSGKYKLIITNTVGCVRTDSILVNVIGLPQVTLMADTAICDKTVIRLRAENLLYTDSIRWTPAAGLSDITLEQPDANPAVTSQYKLTAYNQFCSKADSVVVTVLALPALQVANDTAVCNGQRAYLSASGANTYEWSPAAAVTSVNAASQYITPAASLHLYVKGTGTNGCYANDSMEVVVVPYPQLRLMADTAICEKDIITLRPELLVYTDSIKWTSAAGLTDVTAEKPQVQPVASVSYALTAYNKQCGVSDNVRVDVMSRPLLEVSNDTAVCRGDVLPLEARGASSYRWLPSTGLSQNAIANPVATAATSIRYYVTGTGVNGCTSRDSVFVLVHMPKVFGIYPQTTRTCTGDSVEFTATGGDRYEWLYNAASGGNAASVRVAAINGTYAVVAFDDNCRRQDTLYPLVTVNPLPVLSVLKSNDIDCINGAATLTANGASYYEWWPAATLKGAHTYNPIARTDTSMLYHVKGTDMNGCIAEDSIRVNVQKTSSFNAYPIASAFTPNGDGLNDCFRINKWGFIHSMELAVYNRFGERVFGTTNPDDCWDGRYKGVPQVPGTYVFTVKAQTLCGQVVKKGTLVLIR